MHTDTDTQTQTYVDTDTDTDTESQTDRQTDRDTDTHFTSFCWGINYCISVATLDIFVFVFCVSSFNIDNTHHNLHILITVIIGVFKL